MSLPKLKITYYNKGVSFLLVWDNKKEKKILKKMISFFHIYNSYTHQQDILLEYF